MANVNQEEQVELDKKVTVKNIAGWPVTFRRLCEIGDVIITAEGSIKLSRNEIISQVQNGNRLFTGRNGDGSHPTLFIDDEPTRFEVGFDKEDGTKQVAFSDAVITSLFALKNIETFKKNFQEAIKTRAEKHAAMKAIQKLGLNDYSKIRFVEDYTGFRA